MDNLTARLNAITLMEFKEHYNKSECYRILDFDSECSRMARKLSDELNAKLEGTEYAISVSDFGSIEYRKCLSKGEGSSTWSVLSTQYSPAHELLPYEYVMGGKVGKRVMQRVIDEIEQKCELA